MWILTDAVIAWSTSVNLVSELNGTTQFSARQQQLTYRRVFLRTQCLGWVSDCCVFPNTPLCLVHWRFQMFHTEAHDLEPHSMERDISWKHIRSIWQRSGSYIPEYKRKCVEVRILFIMNWSFFLSSVLAWMYSVVWLVSIKYIMQFSPRI